jgi:uncharacterized membrane protein
MSRFLQKLTAIKETFKIPEWQLGVFGLAHVVILPLLFHTVYRMPYSSIPLYFFDASQVINGSLPYRDFAVEYPPLAFVFFLLPRLFTSTLAAYTVAFQAEVFLFDLLGLYLIYRIARYQGKAPWKMLIVYSIAVLAIGPNIIHTYDIFVAILVLLSLYCFWMGKHKISWVILALGVMTKIYPVVIAPVFLLFYLNTRQYQRMWSGITVFTACILVISLPFLFAGPDSYFSFLSYHAERPLQIETTYSSILMFIGRFSPTFLQLEFGAGSNNLVGPWPEALTQISLGISVFLLLMGYCLIYYRMKTEKNHLPEIGAYSLLVISILVITSKILSPQYLIWLLPLLPLLSGRKRYIIWALFAVTGALSYYIYPVLYLELGNFNSWASIVLLIRNICLVLLTVFTGVSLLRMRTNRQSIENPV